jgi:hypothetical protein
MLTAIFQLLFGDKKKVTDNSTQTTLITVRKSKMSFQGYTYDPNKPLTNGSRTPPPTVPNTVYANPNQPIYQTVTNNGPPLTTSGRYPMESDGYMFSSQSSSKPNGYRSVSMLNPQAIDVQRGHVGTQQNGDIIVQVTIKVCDMKPAKSNP